MPSVRDLESQIFEKEGVRVIIRANTNEDIPAYSFERRLPDTSNLSDLKDRVARSLGDSNYEISVILGDGNTSPHGLTGMGKARNSYK